MAYKGIAETVFRIIPSLASHSANSSGANRCVQASKPRLDELRLANQGVTEQGVNIDQSRWDRDFSCRVPISLQLTAFHCSRLPQAATGCTSVQEAGFRPTPSKFSNAFIFNAISTRIRGADAGLGNSAVFSNHIDYSVSDKAWESIRLPAPDGR